LPVRLHDAHRLGVLRRAVSRIHPRPESRDAVSMDLLPPDPARRGAQTRGSLGLGRSDERAAGVSERDWVGRPERYRCDIRVEENALTEETEEGPEERSGGTAEKNGAEERRCDTETCTRCHCS